MAASLALAAVLLVAAITILPYSGKTAKTTVATTATSVTTIPITSVTISTTSLQTSSATLTTMDYNSSLGLELSMSIAENTITENNGVSLYLSLDNTLATQNNLTRHGGLPFSSYLTCSQLPIGVDIFQGFYDVGNVSHVEPLDLIGSNEVVKCATMPDSWSLAPMSNHITYPTGSAIPASENTTYWGNWSYGGLVFRPFSSGTYTVEGQDSWGQVTILHFHVIGIQNPLDCATISSNSSFARYTNGSAGPGPLKLDAYYVNSGIDNTVVLALTYAGNPTLIPYNTAYWGFSLHYHEPFTFSPNISRTDTWRYYSPNGTLGYPAFFHRDQCVLVSATLPLLASQTTLTLGFSDNQTQTFTFTP